MPQKLDELASLTWLKREFEQLHAEHAVILKRISDIQTVISPEMETQVRRAAGLALAIDQKVPDRNVPPHGTKKEGTK